MTNNTINTLLGANIIEISGGDENATVFTPCDGWALVANGELIDQLSVEPEGIGALNVHLEDIGLGFVEDDPNFPQDWNLLLSVLKYVS